MESTRDAYGKTLVEIGKDNNIVVLDADVSSSTRTNMFAEKYPKRFFNCGISECDMVSQAAGFASQGKVAFASSFASFLAGRAYDQIRCSVAYSKLNVKLVATHSGITVGEDGATHQMLEDIALMRALPNMTVYTASTPKICSNIIKKIAKDTEPTYVRLYRGKAKEEYDTLTDNQIKAAVDDGMILKLVTNSKISDADIVIITMGDMTNIVYDVQKKLKKDNIIALVLDVFRLKPFNTKLFKDILKKVREDIPILTVEDHSINGGLYSIICENISSKNTHSVIPIGMKTFGKSGKAEDVLKYFGLDSDSIYNIIVTDVIKQYKKNVKAKTNT